MIGGKIGGVNVFGGGLALYNSQHELIGGLGVSGDMRLSLAFSSIPNPGG
jgi:hypothetical protein